MFSIKQLMPKINRRTALYPAIALPEEERKYTWNGQQYIPVNSKDQYSFELQFWWTYAGPRKESVFVGKYVATIVLCLLIMFVCLFVCLF
jgi:hypothetical protein